jgi:hypothetical protein
MSADVDAEAVEAVRVLSRLRAEAKEIGAAEERKAICALLHDAARAAEESAKKRPPKGHKHTTAAGWLRLLAGDVMRRGMVKIHEQNKAAEKAEGGKHG